jgi:hypothetical protein
MAVSSNGKTVASGGVTKVIGLWDSIPGSSYEYFVRGGKATSSGKAARCPFNVRRKHDMSPPPGIATDQLRNSPASPSDTAEAIRAFNLHWRQELAIGRA